MAVKINYKFTKERREGVARVMDTLAATSIVGASVGFFGRTVMSTREILGLIAISIFLLAIAFLIRGESK